LQQFEPAQERRSMTKADAIVIGAGQGGKPLALAFAKLGWTVVYIERKWLGGTCINTGCTPTKTMVMSAQVAHYAREAARWGVKSSNVGVDMPAVIKRKTDIVMKYRTGNENKVENAGPNLHFVHAHATFVGPHQVEAGGEIFESEKIFIDTGTRPAIPKIDGIDSVPYFNNETLMEYESLPEHLIVLGGGYIGMEFGQMYRRFGSKVTIIQRGPQILGEEDADIATALQKALESEGMVFRLGATATRAAKRGDGIDLTVTTNGKEEVVSGSHLLCATGRTPNTDGMGIEKAGIALDSRGYVKVNGRMETNVPGVWALGDVKGGPAFTHISYNDYQILYANIIDGKDCTIINRFLPYAVFTDPELGRVGITEKQARASGKKFKMGTYAIENVSRAVERGETAGLMKIIVDAKSDCVLGAAILGVSGGEIVQMLGTLILAGSPYTTLKEVVYIHPTMAEGFWSLLDEVKAVE
jgi:pyruvate/2-oxoglutarate dehydrogenase complex dihydrolipoamide dehydrogenase (E3) component